MSIRAKRIVGLVLLIVGLSWLLLSVLTFTISEVVIDTAFVLQPGEKYGGREDREMVYGTRGFRVLSGFVSVEGGGINLTVEGYAEGLVESAFVDNFFMFTVGPPTEDGYWFTFDNTGGNATSHVEFLLEETLTESFTRIMVRAYVRPQSDFLWMFSLFGAFLFYPIGFTLTFGSLLSKKKEKNHSQDIPQNHNAIRAD